MNRILWGIKTVAAPITAATLIALIVFGFDRRPAKLGDPTLTQLVSFYVGTGLSSGIVLGLLKPLTEKRIGRLAVAAIAALPVSFGLVLMARDWRLNELTGFDIGMAIFLAVVFGPFVAEYARLRSSSSSRDV